MKKKTLNFSTMAGFRVKIRDGLFHDLNILKHHGENKF